MADTDSHCLVINTGVNQVILSDAKLLTRFKACQGDVKGVGGSPTATKELAPIPLFYNPILNCYSYHFGCGVCSCLTLQFGSSSATGWSDEEGWLQSGSL